MGSCALDDVNFLIESDLKQHIMNIRNLFPNKPFKLRP